MKRAVLPREVFGFCANREGDAATRAERGELSSMGIRSHRQIRHARWKQAGLALVLLLLLLTLAGCHGREERAGFEVPAEFDTTREHTLTFWAKNDSNNTQKQIYQKAIRDFQALYPNVKVQLQAYTDYGTIYNDVITNISTDTTPNVCITYPDHIATYLTGNNVVVPLDDLFADERYGFGGSELKFEGPAQDEVVPEFLEECAFAGHHYAIPYMRSTEALYVNRTYVEALGYELPDVLTWDFVWEVAEAATAKNPDGTYAVNGQETMIPFIYKSTDNMMIQMLRQRGAGYSTDAGEILIFNDDTREILKTIAGHAKKGGAFSTFKKDGYPANFLNAGQCIFAVDSTAGATWMGSDAPLVDIAEEKLVRFETAVRPVPQYDPEHPQMISQGPSICVFNKADPQEVLASWLFAQYMLTNDVQIAYSETEGYVPVTVRAQQDPDYLDYLSRAGEDSAVHYAVKLDAARLLMEHTGDTFTTPVFNGSTSLRDAAGQLIESVNTSVKRKQTVDDAIIDKLFADITSLYRLDQISGNTAANGPSDLGPLPGGSVALIAALVGVWLLLGIYTLRGWRKSKKSVK